MTTKTKKATFRNAFPKKKSAKKKPAPRKPRVIETIGEEPAPAKEKKVSALDAAAQVLATAKAPMHAKELIDAMASKGLWTSPGGKTPHATLYAAMVREIIAKGGEARFRKTDRGLFEANA